MNMNMQGILIPILCDILFDICYPTNSRAAKTVYRLIECSSPRKSLVKGERFVRG